MTLKTLDRLNNSCPWHIRAHLDRPESPHQAKFLPILEGLSLSIFKFAKNPCLIVFQRNFKIMYFLCYQDTRLEG